MKSLVPFSYGDWYYSCGKQLFFSFAKVLIKHNSISRKSFLILGFLGGGLGLLLLFWNEIAGY